MEAFEKIQLAFKCPKALDELQPCQSNWYCDGCRKMVYDFRGFSEEAILKTFAQSGQKLCGIYDAARIAVLPQKPRWYTWASVAMFVFGLAACDNYAVGERMIISPRVDSIRNKSVPHSKVHHRKTAKKTKVYAQKNKYFVGSVTAPVADSNVMDINSQKAKDLPIPKIKESNIIMGFVAVDIQPEFPGGSGAIATYFQTHIKNTRGVTGRAFAEFMVERDGTLSNVKIVKGINKELDEQILNAINAMPKWRAGIQAGKPYRAQYTIPINFPAKE